MHCVNCSILLYSCALISFLHIGAGTEQRFDNDLHDFDFEGEPNGSGGRINLNNNDNKRNGDTTAELSNSHSANKLDDIVLGDDFVSAAAANAAHESNTFVEKEKRIRDALLRSTSDKNNWHTMTQLLPILRSLSKPQKMALFAIVSAQTDMRNGNELSYNQVERLFGEKRKLILPIILDIANVVKNASIEQQQERAKIHQQRQHQHKKHQSRQHHQQQQQQQSGKRKYEIMKKRHRRSIEYNENGSQNTHNNDMAMVIKQFQRNLKSTKNNRQRKSTNYFTFYRDMFNRSNMTTTDIRKTDDIEMAADDTADDNTHFDDDNFVHVTLPLLTNRTISLDEYEDLALSELNGTDFFDEYQPDEKLNETLPEPAMLLGNRYHIPINRHPVFLNTRKCELFGNLCLRVEDYPMSQIMRSINRHKNAMSALLAEHPTPVSQYFDHKRNILVKGPVPVSKRREDDERNDETNAGGMCPSVVRYARPQKARSATGEWKFIINTAQHTQTLRLEKCSNPDSSCNYLADNFKSRCFQVYNYHRLLSWDNARGLHVDIFKVPTCCSCHVDSFREQITSTSNKYSTIFADDEDEDEDDEDDDADTQSSIAYQYSNGFKKTPIKTSMPTTSNSAGHASILTMKKMQSMMDTGKKAKTPDVILGSYLKPPNGMEFDGDGSYKKRVRRPIRKNVRDQMAMGSELHTDISPITIIDFIDRPLKRRASTSSRLSSPSDTDKIVISGLPSISTAATSAYDLAKRVNYNYHPILDFFGETVTAKK